MAQLRARRRVWAAGEHQLVHEIAALEYPSVDASVVLWDSKFVPRAFSFCRCLEELERCPAGFVDAGRTPRPTGTVPVLEHNGLRLCCRSHCGCARCCIPPSLRVQLVFPSRKCYLKMQIKTTTTPVTLTEFVRYPLEDVTGQKHSVARKESVIRKKKGRTAQVKPSAHESSSTADRGPPSLCMQRGCPGPLRRADAPGARVDTGFARHTYPAVAAR